ncbi:MAG TPA: NAD-dependent epimerase/dehydratase family protein [Candidatus Angelobacter sp.]|jgi:nucleoside-diphosphate-sugar epimerase|nr:NAD-dependent epimerase/dehydratase family protein [Candidatus Angelobacter sp.]
MVFVTGAESYVGSFILLNLLQKGIKVRALKKKKTCNFLLNKFLEKVEWVEGDIIDIPTLQECINGVREVFHAEEIIAFSKKDIELLEKINIEGTSNIVNICLNNGVKKFCYISSTSTLGRPNNEGFITEDSFFEEDEHSYYGKSKFFSEMEVWRGRSEGLNVVIVNPSIILDPFFFGCVMKKDLRLKVMNSFVSAMDVAKCCIQLMEENHFNERYILNCENISLNRIFSSSKERWKKFKIEYPDIFPTLSRKDLLEQIHKFPYKGLYSNEKIKKTLRFQFLPLKKILDEYLDFLKLTTL